MGEHFQNFEDFDRCLDSLGVQNGRSMLRYKTFADRCVRVCRFGPLSRSKLLSNPEELAEEIVDANDDIGIIVPAQIRPANRWELHWDDEDQENDPRLQWAPTQDQISYRRQDEVPPMNFNTTLHSQYE